MSRRRELERRRRDLADIDAILGAMKSLALMEMRKLGRLVGHQRRLVERLDDARADFFAFHPPATPPARRDVFVVLGSERGFCGNFNGVVVDALASHLAAHRAESVTLVAVGYKLRLELEGDSRVAVTLDGASVAEELGPVLTRLVRALVELAERPGQLAVSVAHHTGDGRGVSIDRLDPFGPPERPAPRPVYPPDLNLPAADVRAGLAVPYLYAALQGSLCGSLMAENLARLRHMETAMRRIEDDALALRRRCDRLRQEEITEEIEVLLLSADAESRWRA